MHTTKITRIHWDWRAILLSLSLVLVCVRAQAVELWVSSYNADTVTSYDTNGALLATIASGGGLNGPLGLAQGTNGLLYVSSYLSDQVKRYDPKTGAFVNNFVACCGASRPVGLLFGSDQNLYVASETFNAVPWFDGNGTLIGGDNFVTNNSGSLNAPQGMTFGPDGHLYVGSVGNSLNISVKRYNGATGAYINDFVTSGSGGLLYPTGLTFGPDGNLYVSDFSANVVRRYNGTSGAYLGDFATAGGLSGAYGLAFGPAGDLYVSSFFDDTVKRYHGTTGAYLGDFATTGLDGPTYLIFIPEPTSLGLLGLAGVFLLRRQK